MALQLHSSFTRCMTSDERIYSGIFLQEDASNIAAQAFGSSSTNSDRASLYAALKALFCENNTRTLYFRVGVKPWSRQGMLTAVQFFSINSAGIAHTLTDDDAITLDSNKVIAMLYIESGRMSGSISSANLLIITNPTLYANSNDPVEYPFNNLQTKLTSNKITWNGVNSPQESGITNSADNIVITEFIQGIEQPIYYFTGIRRYKRHLIFNNETSFNGLQYNIEERQSIFKSAQKTVSELRESRNINSSNINNTAQYLNAIHESVCNTLNTYIPSDKFTIIVNSNRSNLSSGEKVVYDLAVSTASSLAASTANDLNLSNESDD